MELHGKEEGMELREERGGGNICTAYNMVLLVRINKPGTLIRYLVFQFQFNVLF